MRVMKKNLAPLRNSGPYTNLGSPDYGGDNNNNGGFPKGSSSERVPLPTNSIHRHTVASVLMPVSVGRALPSKWDDAERWVTSPVSAHGATGACRSRIMRTRRQSESNSAPLGINGLANLSDYSPIVPGNKGGGTSRNLSASSPLITGVFMPNDDGFARKFNLTYPSNSMARSTSMPGFLDVLSNSSLSSSHDDKINGTHEEETTVSRAVSRRDMATQMSPVCSTHSSLKGSLSFCVTPSPTNHSVRNGVRDVEVDEATNIASKPIKRKMKKGLLNIQHLRSPRDVSEASRLQREEAKITAWENLQMAKAAAAIRKLEMELETKRSACSEKILNKLKAAQIKGQAMRDSISVNHSPKALTTSHRAVFLCKYVKMGSLSNCFFCCRK